MDAKWRFKPNTEKKKCDSCEAEFFKSVLQYDGGFWLCTKCKIYMDKEYEILREKEEAEWLND